MLVHGCSAGCVQGKQVADCRLVAVVILPSESCFARILVFTKEFLVFTKLSVGFVDPRFSLPMAMKPTVLHLQNTAIRLFWPLVSAIFRIAHGYKCRVHALRVCTHKLAVVMSQDRL